MPRPARWISTLRASIDEATLAVRLYNDSGQSRAFEGFVVHMHLAWLYLLQARFARDGIDYRYRRPDDPRRFVVVDGEHKRWELAKCVAERWTNADDPVRRNLEFFIALRNRVEHRHASTDRDLGLTVSGHAQAFLLNFEDELVSTFGAKYSLAEILRFPVFVGTFTTDGEQALLKLRDRLPADLKRFIAQYHSGLPEATAADSRFELRLRVVLEMASRDADAMSMQFTRWDDMTEEERSAVAEMGRRGQTIVREQSRPVVGHGLLRPREAELKVADAVPYRFTSHHFLRAWQIKKIRPVNGSDKPERTDEKYCMYDALGRGYGYTEAWVKYLIKQCSTAEGFQAVTGRSAEAKGASGGQ
ncbi:DUF3644 domain-containing protein [Microbacterium sp. HMWF026]|uniref:DUF3644 domain-containing protein n=1 Tax=Microbacterium sp. HMWF026 TaxID=2056861 RepID=UPI002159EA57|nr:DUF3644 domain-containing protein [Microbacterium sp. HMWF026]